MQSTHARENSPANLEVFHGAVRPYQSNPENGLIRMTDLTKEPSMALRRNPRTNEYGRPRSLVDTTLRTEPIRALSLGL